MPNKFWEVKNQTEDSADLLIYGSIMDNSWDENDVVPKEFNKELEEINDVDKINVRINSYGGSVFAGQSILSMLKRHNADIDVYIDGIAASIASVIAMAGNKIYMPKNAMLMIHNPWTMGMGNANDFRDLADELDKIRESIVAAYQEKTDLPNEDIIDYLDKETWFTAEEAVELGFADEIEEREVSAKLNKNNLVMNSVEFDLEKFDNVPSFIKNLNNSLEKNNKKSKKVNNQGGKENMPYKEFETEEKFDEFKNDYKEEVLEGYVKAEDVLNKFTEIDLEGENLEEIVNAVEELKNDLEETNEKYQEQQENIKFAKRKNELEKVGVEVKDEDREEILNMSKKTFEMLVNSNKEKLENSKNDEDDLDVNGDFLNLNLEDGDLENIAAGL